MGVRILVGHADGTKQAAAMYDSGNGWMVGPIWEGADAYEQIESFQQWLRSLRYIEAINDGALNLEPLDLPNPGVGDGSDPRAWPDHGLKKLVDYWRSRFLDEDGWLREEAQVSG